MIWGQGIVFNIAQLMMIVIIVVVIIIIIIIIIMGRVQLNF